LSIAPEKTPTAKIKVLIADDHVTVREGLAAIIGRQSDMLVVAEAATGRDAVDFWRQQRPDIVLLDLRMPVLDGVAAMGEIRQQDPSARIVVLTTFDTDHEISRAVKAGEMHVLTLLAQGKGNKEIGLNLHISETTVKSHLRSIFNKLNVLSRTEAIAVASRRGLLQL